MPSSPGALLPEPEPAAVDPAQVRAAAAWVQQWSRTLKTWRLYGPQNPASEKFRAELAAGLEAFLEAWGPLQLKFTADAVLSAGTLVHQARSREDNLSVVFYRDGIRSVVFSPGFDRAELEVFLGAMLRVTDRSQHADEDLVTLLWDAGLEHLDMDYVSAEAWLDLDDDDETAGGRDAGGPRGDAAGGASGERGIDGGPPMAWPRAERAMSAAPEPAGPVPPTISDRRPTEVSESAVTRSEDWPSRDPSRSIVEPFDDLDRLAGTEVARFLHERAAEGALERGAATLTLMGDVFGSGLEAHERQELVPIVERLVFDALGRGAWAEARRGVELLLVGRPPDAECAWLAPLVHADSVVTAGVVQHLDRQGHSEVAEFLALVAALGVRGLDWYLLVLAESQQQRVRRPLAHAIAAVAAGEIPRLARWLDDRRWYVVRNIVHILHWIGGDAAVPPLRAVLAHEDRRVRIEVLAVLAKASPEAARPLLLELLETDDARVLSGALHLLSSRRDAEVARRILARLGGPAFLEEPPQEQRALLSALGATGDDAVLPTIALLLDPPRKPAQEAAALLQGLALCAARIATPAALELLQRAQRSRWQATREAAALALAAGGSR